VMLAYYVVGILWEGHKLAQADRKWRKGR
jgi:hypothetical protein